jgi:hypothetical protein
MKRSEIAPTVSLIVLLVPKTKRHKIIHGMANEDSPDDRPASEEKVHIMRDHPKHYFSERYSVPQILAIADEIADKRRYAGTVFLRVGRAREQAAGAF